MTPRVAIVGAGVIGSAAACFLARDFGLRATVFERDPSYRHASSALSASSIRQQFSTEINIQASLRSLAFLRCIGDQLAIDGDRPQIGLTEPGYLYLASAAGEAALRAKHAVQARCGADVALLEPGDLRSRFPWLTLDDIALGSLGLTGEGWFDGYSVLQAFRGKAIALGARFVAAAVHELRDTGAGIRARTQDGAFFDADAVLIAAGAWSATLSAQLGFALPVAPRKRDVFVFESPAHLPGCPLVIDPSGFWFRPEGRRFICGAPPRGADPPGAALDDIDFRLFDEVIWPGLAARVPAFLAVRLRRAWAGYYEFNDFDQNGLVGRLPGCDRAYVACGFSGHGMQQAPAIGRGIAELIATGSFHDLDLTPLAPLRLTTGRKLLESNVI